MPTQSNGILLTVGMPTAIFDQASTTTDDMRNDQMET